MYSCLYAIDLSNIFLSATIIAIRYASLASKFPEEGVQKRTEEV